VLATRVGGIPDVVHDGVNGFLVDEGHAKGLAAAIERLLDEPGLLAELRAGIEPPTRVREHARALRVFYANCLGRPEEQEPPLLYSCSTADEVVAAVAGAIQDGGRQGVRIEAAGPEAEAAVACLRGDLRVHPARITGQPAMPHELDRTGWLARWPEDEDTLAGALALAAIYPELLAGIEIGIEGDVAQAAAATLERLGAEGITHESLPDMLIRPAGEQDTRALSELPAHLATAGTGELWIGDDHGNGAASGLLALGGADHQHVALIGDELELAHDGPLTIVTDAPLVRQVAEALGMTAAGRDENAIATADVVAVDGRRPEDLWLARGASSSGTVVIAHGSRHTAASLRAFGLALTAVDEPSGTALASSVI
jgi:glycosyl transferase family 1